MHGVYFSRFNFFTWCVNNTNSPIENGRYFEKLKIKSELSLVPGIKQWQWEKSHCYLFA